MTRALFVAPVLLVVLLVVAACHDAPSTTSTADVSATSATPTPAVVPAQPTVAAPPPPSVPEAAPTPDEAKIPVPDEDDDDDGKAELAALREDLAAGLRSARNRARLTRLLEAGRRNDRPMLRYVLAEADARARAGTADAMEWKTTMNRFEDVVNEDDPPPVVGDVWDRVVEEHKRVDRASDQERAAMWKHKADEQERVDRFAGETFGMPGTRLQLRKPDAGMVTRRVHTDGAGKLRLERDDP